MPKNYILSLTAQTDLRNILKYIGNDNISAADNMRKLFMEAFKHLGENPYLGQERFDLSKKSVRFWAVHRSYMIIYNPSSTPVEISRIYNTARDISSVLH